MSRRYTHQEKTLALQRLDDNFGNVSLTAIQTNISKRTLQEWRNERRVMAFQSGQPDPETLLREKNIAQQQQQNPDPLSYKEENEYAFIRNRLLQHIHAMLENLVDEPDSAHLRVMALTRLLDRVIKLETQVQFHRHEQVIRFEYSYDNAIHSVPPWLNKPEYVEEETDPIGLTHPS